jgi:ABC-2 type transport system permease protein
LATGGITEEQQHANADVRPRHMLGGIHAQRLRALIVKEFLQLRRDPRSLLMVLGMPVIFLFIFGYGVHFDVQHIPAVLVGNDAPLVRSSLQSGGKFDVKAGHVANESTARSALRDGSATVAVIVGQDGLPAQVLVDGSEPMTTSTALGDLRQLSAPGQAPLPVSVLYNPTLNSAFFLIPSLVGMIMMQVGMTATALGVVRERERGTLEQLMITPLSRVELVVGKIVPYLLLAAVDVVVIIVLGLLLFGVPLRGNVFLLFLLSGLFILSTLGMGLLVSTVAQNQRQAMQTATLLLLPQILLSGSLFPLSSIPLAIRWLSYVMPLTYFSPITRGIFLKGTGLAQLWPQAVVLAVMAAVFIGLSAVTFRKQLG